MSFRPHDPDRLGNLDTLLDDMKSLNLDVTRQAEILRVEKIVSQGSVVVAMQDWIKGPSYQQHTFDQSQDKSASVSAANTAIVAAHDVFEAQLVSMNFDKEWLELGARLHALMGNNRRVSSIVKKLGSHSTKIDPRMSASVIQSLNHAGSAQQVEQAWSMFNAVLRTPDFSIPLQDLSAICGSFLKSGNLPYATSILSLMAQRCDGTENQQLSIFVAHYSALLMHAKTLEEIDNISLELLPHLPENDVVAGRFFDTWLSHSSKAGDEEHTSEIIELMFEKGRAPQARHIDKLLDVWIKSAGSKKSEKTESLALSMIKKQLDAIVGLTEPLTNFDEQRPKFKKFLRRPVPRADARTYVLLTSHYAKLGDVQAAKQTLRLMTNSSQLRLDGQLTRAILAIHFTMKDFQGAWQFCQLLRETDAFHCDMRTAAVLWKGVNLHLITNKTQSLADYPGPRFLFDIMLKDLFNRQGSSMLKVNERPSESMYERIVHCFCLAEDTPGLILALHSMKIIFNLHPSHKTVLSVINHVAHRLAWRFDREDRPATFRSNVDKQIQRLSEILKTIWMRMQDAEPSHRLFSFPGVFGRQPRNLKGKRRDIQQAKGEEMLMLLTLLIRYCLLKDPHLAQRFPKAIDKARVEMGLIHHPEVDSRITDLRTLAA